MEEQSSKETETASLLRGSIPILYSPCLVRRLFDLNMRYV